MHPRLFLAGIVLSVLTGCSSQPTDAPLLPQFPAAAVGTSPASRARYSWADQVNVGTVAAPDWVPAGFRGDGRLRDGTPGDASTSNEYQGDFCGVSAVIGSGSRSQSADFNYDVDANWLATLPESCQPARSYLVYFNGPSASPATTRPHQIIAGVYTMAVGESRIQPFKTGTLGDVGIGFQFDDAYPPSSSVLVTRLPDNVDPYDGRTVRQWRVESRGSHLAMGFVQSTGKKPGNVSSGITYFLPFVLTITEVPFPSPTYP